MAAKLMDKEAASNVEKNDQNDTTKCTAHVEQDIVLFCLTCEEGICLICIPENKHCLHDLYQIQEVADIMQKEFQELLQKEGAEKLQLEIEKKNKEIDSRKKAIVRNQEKLETDICSRAENLGKFIEETKQRLSLLSDHAFTEQLKLLNNQESEGSECLALLKKYSDDPDSFLNDHKNDIPTVVEYLRGLQITDHIVADGLAILPDDFMEMIEENVLNTNNTDAEFSLTLQGEMTGEPVQANDHASDECLLTLQYDPEMTGEYVQKIFGVLTDPTQTSKSDPRTAVHSRLVKEFKVGNDRSRYYVGKISPVDSKKAYILANEILYKVKFGSEQDEHSIVPGVQDITHVSDKGIFLCTKTHIMLCTFDNKLYHLDKVVNSKTQFRSICITKDGNVAYCSDESVEELKHGRSRYVVQILFKKSRLHIIRQNGVKVETVDLGTIHNKSLYLYRLADQHHEIYFLERYSDHGLVVKADKVKYDKTNFYEGNIGSNPAQLFDPRGICFDAEGKIIIADYSNHAIHLLDNDGRFLKFLLRQWEGLEHPTAVAVDKMGFLWISQENGTIQIRSYV